MKLADVLAKYHYPDAVRGILSGIENLYPPQAAAIDKGVLDGKNMLLSVPTAAGKTLIAELCLLKSVLLNKGRCLYIAPLKALASEKFNDFKKKYEPLGIPVGLAIGDADSPVRHLNQYKILVATAEKVDSLLRTHAQGLINSLSVVVFDEIHFINDASRGPTLEILVARIKELNPQIQILALSATVSNAAQIAAWLKAELVTSTWRPIPLKEGIYFNDTIMFHEYGTKLIREEEADDLSKLTLDTLRGKGQVLIFVNSRRSAQAVSRQVLGAAAKVLAPAERQQLSGIAKKIIGSRSDATKLCRKLAEVIAGGVAFHHAGLKPHQRELIEDNFRNNLIKVISCTPTLAAGVNLPARRAIIRDVKRYEAGIGPAYIPTSEYKQCAGRAGRPQYDDYGEAVIVAKSLTDTRILYDKYIAAPPEPVTSKLANQAALRIHILASIAGGYIHDIKGMIDFFHHTLLYHQKLAPNLLEMVSEIFDFLHKEKFIEKSGVRFFPTPLGSLTSRIYIDPVTTMTLRDGLIKAVDDNQFAAAGLIHLMDCCPDAPLMHVGKKDAEGLEQFESQIRDQLIFTPENWPGLEDFFAYQATLKTTWAVLQWIDEEKEEMICDQFGVGPGDIYRHVESTQWLVYAAISIANMLHFKKLTFALEQLRNRIRYGIKEELLELVQLRGVGRVRARKLFDHGFKHYTDLRSVSLPKLAEVPQIGKTIAQDILQQVATRE